jgi:hypothetical protein
VAASKRLVACGLADALRCAANADALVVAAAGERSTLVSGIVLVPAASPQALPLPQPGRE